MFQWLLQTNGGQGWDNMRSVVNFENPYIQGALFVASFLPWGSIFRGLGLLSKLSKFGKTLSALGRAFKNSKFGRFMGRGFARMRIEGRRGLIMLPGGKRPYNALSHWNKGNSKTVEAALAYHLREHGRGRSAEAYTRAAMKFYKRYRGNMEYGRDTYGNLGYGHRFWNGRRYVGGWWDDEGRIYSFWD